MEILFGEGGDDSKQFVHELYNAYRRYAGYHNIAVELWTEDDGHIIAKFKGSNVWSKFQHESGKHCVQRIPSTEKNGRKQTSMVSVALLPLLPEKEYPPLKSEDLDIKFQTGRQKAGGQNANKVASAVRMTHKPTGYQVFINGRDQGQNKKEALRILTAKVHDQLYVAQDREFKNLRKQQIDGGGRGNKVRTYNYLEGRVVDHKLNTKTSQVKRVIEKGEFDLLFVA
jgi:peptide chain release factor 1